MKKSAVIVGATSGIGAALAFELSKRGYVVGLTGRRTEKLEELQKQLPGPSLISTMDVTRFDESRDKLKAMIEKMAGFELLVLNAGTGGANKYFEWEIEKSVIDTNITGFSALLNVGWNYFVETNKPGHIVGISSVASHIPNGHNSVYSASKAFVSTYLTGLQIKARKRGYPITITDIKPGFVETPMTSERTDMFWVSSVEKAARQIAEDIDKKRPHSYITRRWRLVGWVAGLLPWWVYRKFGK